MFTIVLAGRNDDYGGNFKDRLFQATELNAARFLAAGIRFEFLFVEWNPVADRAPLSLEFVRQFPNASAYVVPPAIHERYGGNGYMPFHEMAAKNIGLRRAQGDIFVVLNADVVLGDEIVEAMAGDAFRIDTLYRAHRVDVPAGLTLEEMKDPACHLVSGEGALAPCYYLGAAGDFCLASKSLWYRLGGFNERVRFSTRAKDWQFFLSAAARGIPIEFVGTVYHLDHREGFQNTAQDQLESPEVHFGTLWDIEFGLPYENGSLWGFADLSCRELAQGYAAFELSAERSGATVEPPRQETQLAEWLTGSRMRQAALHVQLLHLILAAHRHRRRLLCRIDDPALLVALSGMAAVASTFGVEIFSNWVWPEISGLRTRPFWPEPVSRRRGDWLLEYRSGRLELTEGSECRESGVLSAIKTTATPVFNPVLRHRLLKAYLQMQDLNLHRIVIYGAGSHTEQLLSWGVPDTIDVLALAVTDPQSRRLSGRPVVTIESIQPDGVDALLISSCTHEPEMVCNAERLGFRNILPLYGNWPPDFWSPGGINAICRSADVGYGEREQPANFSLHHEYRCLP